MSYASVAANNAPPIDQQPQPDQRLLNTRDDAPQANKVPAPSTSDNKKPNRRLHEAEAESLYLWQAAKHYLLRPGVAGGLVGLVNIGLLATAGRAFYTQPRLRRDASAISTTIATTLAILSLEGYAANRYRETPGGREEERRAKEEGSLLYKHIRENVFRPGVLGGLVGIFNAAILGSVGYFSYIHWNRPAWDRRIVSAVSVGVLMLWGGEGAIAERYRKKRR